jgi:hypothetical protein
MHNNKIYENKKIKINKQEHKNQYNKSHNIDNHIKNKRYNKHIIFNQANKV